MRSTYSPAAPSSLGREESHAPATTSGSDNCAARCRPATGANIVSGARPWTSSIQLASACSDVESRLATLTADGGQSWQQLPVQGVAQAATPYFFGPLGFSAPSGGTLWLVGSRAIAGRMLVSHDGGLTWQAPTF